MASSTPPPAGRACVGWLSRPDLATRPGDAGPQLATPEAQCLGRHEFEYALRLGDLQGPADVIRRAHDYRYAMVGGPGVADLSGLLSLEGEGFCVSALKGAEDGRGLILRLYNPSSASAVASLKGRFRRLWRCRLDETDEEELKQADLQLEPFQIASLRLA